MKFNCDAVVLCFCSGRLGTIAQHYSISVLAVTAYSLVALLDVLVAEVLAVVEINIILESDCLCLVNFVNEGRVHLDQSGSVILDILDLMGLFLIFSFCLFLDVFCGFRAITGCSPVLAFGTSHLFVWSLSPS